MNRAEDASADPRRAHPGFLLVIEGIDGTGKSTLVKALAAGLRHRGVDCVESREPTDGPHGRRIREIARSGRDNVSLEEELSLFVEDRREHVSKVIRPNLEAGRVVILDRYFYSTMAYQGARGGNPEAIRQLHENFAPEADLLVILELNVEAALDRVEQSRGSTPDAFEGRDYLAKVDAEFRRIEHPNLLRLDAGDSTEDLVGCITSHLPDQLLT